MAPLRLMAADLGAESGRCIAGEFDGRTVRLTEVHRFANGPVRLPDGLHWDVLRLFEEIKAGARRTRQEGPLHGLGVDTWGLDFALLDRDGALLHNPFHYRDRRTEGMLEAAFARVPREEIFRHTGIQFMSINSLFQLLSMAVSRSAALESASTFVMMPDLFNYWLTGEIGCEFTDATTSQCYDPTAGNWAFDLLERLGVPTRIFPRVLPPGTVLGRLHSTLGEDLGAPDVTVIAPACHDTASAVAAVPAASARFAYISSGTWSLVGTEVAEPVLTAETLAGNFTNEGGVGGRFRLLRNVVGLWLLQECRRRWARDDDGLSYETLTREAASVAPFGPLIDPDDEGFLRPTDMPQRIREFCRARGQEPPESRGQVVRCILESLALRYRWVIEHLDVVVGQTMEVIHIVGGGSRNALLCQLTADAAGRPVLAGPVEATAMGNILIQAQALGHLGSLEDIRQITRRAAPVTTYEPEGHDTWDDAYARFLRLGDPGAARRD
jgi:rhamnulokinase